MDSQGFNSGRVDPYGTGRRSPRSSHSSSLNNNSESTIRQHQHEPRRLTQESVSPQPTLVPHAPTPPSPQRTADSTPELYGPDRFFNQSLPAPAYDAAVAASALPPPNPAVRFDEAQLAMFALANPSRIPNIKDELALAAGRVTPGVDDSPYILYAIEALTRDRNGSGSRFPSGTTSDDYSVDHTVQRPVAETSVSQPPVAQPNTAYFQDEPPRSQPAVTAPLLEHEDLDEPLANYYEPPRSSLGANAKAPSSDRWAPVTKEMRASIDPRDRTHPPLTYKPRILRPFSMLILMTLCTLMIAGLVVSAVYTDRNDGLTPYPGTIYSGQYFLFRILPQILAAVILIYAQSIVTASLRILPFKALAKETGQERRLALFQSLYPKSLLWPQLRGPWQFKIFSVAAWLALFTIPLQSTAFTCIYIQGEWVWGAVQGVAWTLVVIYAMLLLSTAILMAYWFGQWTGLLWDVRSIADLLPLLSRSNTMGTYRQGHFATGNRDSGMEMRDRWFDRLGYWQADSSPAGGIWYAIGTSATPYNQATNEKHQAIAKRASYDASFDSRDVNIEAQLGRGGQKYLPWCLRTGTVAAVVGVASVLLLVLLIVCFLPSTRLDAGFRPLLPARPDAAAFSPANFLFGFLPSALGMLLYILLQSLDQSVRVLQPWGELRKSDGSVAHKSILLDYAASLPLQVTVKAIRNRHFRVAAISLLGVLSIFIPILAGGVFMALTVRDSDVRMFPNIPVLGVLLAFLFLYVGAWSLMLPRRDQFRLPHSVMSLAGIIDLCAAEDLTQDAAFQAVRSRQDLEGRLGIGREDPRDESVWFLGLLPGRDEQRISVRRMNRFTEMKRTTRHLRAMV
ncbi:hypothetical protein HJFPF1_04791 [Paramyrothecium foliicola]|nr:hypothetical protein HJFPF1_04791 [Paramyrothecium foliicola]